MRNECTVAGSVEDKAGWTSELAQCMESAALTELLRACGACGAASASLPACRSDRALFTDDVDIRFSRTHNSCKVPQIRSATPQRLLQRLTGMTRLKIFISVHLSVQLLWIHILHEKNQRFLITVTSVLKMKQMLIVYFIFIASSPSTDKKYVHATYIHIVYFKS